MKRRTNQQLKFSVIALVMLMVTLCVTPFRHAQGAPAFLSITVTNNATRPILHLYLSPADHDAWGPDLMSQNTSINTGQSFTITDVACSANEIKVVAEDQQGCFSYGVVSCAQGTTTWTITNDTPVDCGN
jgi:hypothetical protein